MSMAPNVQWTVIPTPKDKEKWVEFWFELWKVLIGNYGGQYKMVKVLATNTVITDRKLHYFL